jgi:hypothetical protein
MLNVANKVIMLSVIMVNVVMVSVVAPFQFYNLGHLSPFKTLVKTVPPYVCNRCIKREHLLKGKAQYS